MLFIACGIVLRLASILISNHTIIITDTSDSTKGMMNPNLNHTRRYIVSLIQIIPCRDTVLNDYNNDFNVHSWMLYGMIKYIQLLTIT